MTQENDITVSDGRSPLSPEQANLVRQKMSVLQEARDLQAKLATARAELSRIDAEMLDTDFELPVLACW